MCLLDLIINRETDNTFIDYLEKSYSLQYSLMTFWNGRFVFGLSYGTSRKVEVFRDTFNNIHCVP